jgi:hypothetical protein
MIFSYEEIYKTNWQAHKLASEIFARLDSPNNLVFSTTWAGEKDFETIDNWLTTPSHKAIIISLFDPNEFQYHHTRAIHIDTRNILFWLLTTDKYFLEYTKEDTTPAFEYNFLCYQRKPIDYRVKLYDLLKSKNGIVTLGTQEYSFNKDLPEHGGYKDVGGELPIPNDIYSLGNIEVWNKCFLNIVSETVQRLDTDFPFISEKVFKPIIGMRPFIVYGHPKTSEYLRNMGFETFDSDFGFSPKLTYEESANEISKVIDGIDNVELLYKKLLPKITHNYENFRSIAQREWKKLDDLVLTLKN